MKRRNLLSRVRGYKNTYKKMRIKDYKDMTKRELVLEFYSTSTLIEEAAKTLEEKFLSF